MTARVHQPPQLLPPDICHFTDRQDELGALDALMAADGSGPAAMVITAIAGTAGMGKTSLAVRWAHRVRDRFPDGQLYVNLRGYDAGPPVTPEQALDGFLRALGVSAEAIPAGLDAMAGYYRSLVSDREMLVILDNAATPDQARPLLPASPRCVVLVTSRSRMSGLVAREGARRITLDLLSVAEANALLRTIIGPGRVDREPEAVAALAQRCAYLPLALRIAAERVLARPRRRIADLVSDLAVEQGRLDALAADDDEATAVRAVFSWSYRALNPEAARLFRLLGLHPGPEISVPMAAALAVTSPATTLRLLDALASVHLVEEIGPDRYTFHDLLRSYAAELAVTDESEMEPDRATGRVLGWYLHSAHAASRIAWPSQPPKPLDSSEPDCQPMDFASAEEALSWLDGEVANLMAAIHHAAAIGWRAVAWQLPVVLVDFFVQRSRWSYLIESQHVALAAAEELRNRQAQFWALASLAEAYIELERFDEALPMAQRALAVSREQGSRRSEGGALHDLGLALRGLGRLAEAIDHLEQALAIYREVDDERGVGIVLSVIGDTLRLQQRFDEALDYAHRGVTLLRQILNRWNEAAALHRLGQTYLDLQRFDDAVETLAQAHALFRDLDSTYEAARALQSLGEAQHGTGDLGKARQSWIEAVVIFDELNPPKAISLRERLDALGPATPA